jgi:hypothetical protein
MEQVHVLDFSLPVWAVEAVSAPDGRAEASAFGEWLNRPTPRPRRKTARRAAKRMENLFLFMGRK